MFVMGDDCGSGCTIVGHLHELCLLWAMTAGLTVSWSAICMSICLLWEMAAGLAVP